MPKVKKLDKEVEGGKRTHVPFAVEWTCRKCGAENVNDYSKDHYLSYPTWGSSKAAHLYCDKCEHEQTIRLRADVTLTIEVNT